jgi:hypothetical protein
MFLWHFPWGRPRRALPGTVLPWSPDFPPPPCGKGDHPAVWQADKGRGACRSQTADRGLWSANRSGADRDAAAGLVVEHAIAALRPEMALKREDCRDRRGVLSAALRAEITDRGEARLDFA